MRTSILPSGREILARIEAAGKELPKEVEQEILAITDEDAMAAFLAMNLGETINPNEMEAGSVFSQWMVNKLALPPMLFTIMYDAIGQCNKAIEMANKELARTDITLTPEQRNSDLRTLIEALRQKGGLVKTAFSMAAVVKPPSGKKRPRNQAPDTLQTVLVQVNQPVQSASNEAKPTLDAR